MFVVSSYTRAQAIQDGVLIDVTKIAAEAGFKIPVAITQAVWLDCVQWDEETKARKKTAQDEEGRLWDVVYMALVAARSAPSTSRSEFVVYRVPVAGNGRTPQRVTLTMQTAGGDEGEPVLTIMQPTEG